jgi:DNA-binding response OmpR family regulator
MAGKKILIVEDEVVQLTALARRLKSAGFEVVAARDGLTAISTARKEQPDLIVLDLGIPAGDGSESRSDRLYPQAGRRARPSESHQ